MVEKYVILADSINAHEFTKPRQLTKINGEKLIERTIRLLKENRIKDITVTSHDKRFDNLGAKRYEPLYNDYEPLTEKGYWLNAFPEELLNEPICFIWGDVYFSEEAIKTIVNTDTDSTLFFASYENNCKEYIKDWDEPFAYKVVDTDLFKKHIEIVKKMYDEKATCRHPVVWELYRSINGQDVNVHQITTNFVKINDVTCDVDEQIDADKIQIKVRKDTNKKLSIVIAYYQTYDLTKKLLDILIPQLTEDVEVLLIDDGCNEKRLDEYKNKINIVHLKENKGGAFASNEGIRQSRGKYIAFVDSDDMIVQDYVKTLIETINKRNEDVIIFDWQDMNTGFIVRRPCNYAPWKAIYNREIIPLFPEGRKYSYDVPFYDELVAKKYSEYYIDKILYYYNSNRDGSLTVEKAKKIKEENSK